MVIVIVLAVMMKIKYFALIMSLLVIFAVTTAT